jgi:hypothetical protein
MTDGGSAILSPPSLTLRLRQNNDPPPTEGLHNFTRYRIVILVVLRYDIPARKVSSCISCLITRYQLRITPHFEPRHHDDNNKADDCRVYLLLYQMCFDKRMVKIQRHLPSSLLKANDLE